MLPSNRRKLHVPQARRPRGSGTPTGRGAGDRRRRLALRPRGCRCTRAFWRVKPPKERPAALTSSEGLQHPTGHTPKSKLLIHNRTHTGERPYSCCVCGKAFSEKSNLATHIRTHTGERPHSCSVCCKAFSKKSILITHMFTHTGDRPFSCDVCGKAVINKSHLAYHMLSHSGKRLYSCSGKAFSHKSTLTSHMRTHSGERPHSCSVCGKAFSKKSNLTSHMRTHWYSCHGANAFRFEECDVSVTGQDSSAAGLSWSQMGSLHVSNALRLLEESF